MPNPDNNKIVAPLAQIAYFQDGRPPQVRSVYRSDMTARGAGKALMQAVQAIAAQAQPDQVGEFRYMLGRSGWKHQRGITPNGLLKAAVAIAAIGEELYKANTAVPKKLILQP